MLTQCLIVSGLTLLATLSALLHPQEWYFWLISFVGIGELTLSFRLVRENERVVPVFLGRIESEVGVTLTAEEITDTRRRPRSGLLGTGIAFFLFPFYELRRFPMVIQQFKVPVGKVVTRPGTPQAPNHPQRPLGSAELDLEVVVNYQWDVSNLAPAVANAPPPTGPDGKPHPDLLAILTPEVDDATKTAAANRTWYDIYFDRGGMESDIEQYLLGTTPPQAGRPVRVSALVRAGLRDSARISISLPKVDLPETLKTAINEEQTALFRGEATRRAAEAEADATKRRAEAERFKREQEGIGLAEARKKLYDAIRGASLPEGEQNRLAEALVTLREMAQGQASTIFVPEVVTTTLGQAFGEMRPQRILENLFAGLTPQQKERLLTEALQELRRGRGNR